MFTDGGEFNEGQNRDGKQCWRCSHFCSCGRIISFAMCDDKPVKVSKCKWQVTSSNCGRFTCIVHYPQSRDTEILEYARIHTAVTVLQMQAFECSHSDDIWASVPENFDACRHGHHRWCYKNFTYIAWLKNLSELPGTCLSTLTKTVGTSQSAMPCVHFSVIGWLCTVSLVSSSFVCKHRVGDWVAM